MSLGRPYDSPAFAVAVRRLGSVAAAPTLLCYGLVHLLVWPGAPTGTPDERYRWNGESTLLDSFTISGRPIQTST
ncbi:hypothetical protein Manayef4_02470 [Frankia sp. CgMI4]|uniref:hypothetical protein n=1 Tax=Frankia sp. CgMI4 TaxID=1742262 RepID=UPI0008728475|nr:hypothetical protein [Frankia sp. CgIM4]OFB41459.1 hypothetical protein Manayef4_02470 [Frankia sp. CgIM4]